jgi:hypothetical protein
VKIQTAKEEQKNRRPSALSEVGLGETRTTKEDKGFALQPGTFL